MPSVSRLQRKKPASEEDKMLMGFFAAVACLDYYLLSKTDDKGVELFAYKGPFKEKFVAKKETDILEPLGTWLCKLPKGVWG